MNPDYSNELLHYEQFVNDRLDTSSPPDIEERYLPEYGHAVPLAWRLVAPADASVFCTDDNVRRVIESEFRHGNKQMIPIHPLEESRISSDELVYSGKIRFSASYRTVFYEPDSNSPLSGWCPQDKTLMLKLHLEEPLPGIPGDRRLTESIISKCVYLSSVLPAEIQNDDMGEDLEIVPEFFGITAGDCGVLLRLLPASGVVPGFSVYSKDRQYAQHDPLIVRSMRNRFGENSAEAAERFGADFARPLVRSLIAGFRKGISLEMHAQNTLVQLGSDASIQRVFVRDMEGTVVFNEYRGRRGLEPLGSGLAHKLEAYTDASIKRLFNRNLDHDIGRMFTGTLRALRHSGFFDSADSQAAVRSVRRVVRQAIEDGDITDICGLGRYLPLSRAPWGSGLRPGHYFRTHYR